MSHNSLISTLPSQVCIICILVFVNITECYTGRYYTILKPIRTTTLKPFTINIDIDFGILEALNEERLKSIGTHRNWDQFDDEICGESYGSRIVGGVDSNLGDYPWIARLGRYKIMNGIVGKVDWFCAGTLINKHYVVSAAHCTNNNYFRLIRLGEYDTNSVIDCDITGICAAPPQDRIPLEVINHHKFNGKIVVTPHDISLIRMSKPVEYNGWVAPICLPKQSSPAFTTGVAETIGWGLTIPLIPSYASILQNIKLPIITETECRRRFYRELKRGTFCAGGMLNKDSCNGDSGGPLLKADDFSGIPKYYLIGIVSFGPSHCGNGEAGAYTNVTYHLPWILENMKRLQ